MRYFFDNNLSIRYVKMLRALDVDAKALCEEFAQDFPDTRLFEELRGQNVTFVTGDTGIQTRTGEAKALRECGITALFLGPFWDKLKFWPQSAWLVKHWPVIDGFVNGVERGTSAEVKQNGKSMIFRI